MDSGFTSVPDSAWVTVTGLTLIGFHPMATNEQLQRDDDLATMLDDFAYHIGTAMDSLTAAGAAVHYRGGDTLWTRVGANRWRFVRPPDSAAVGYLLTDETGRRTVIYGVRTYVDLLAHVREFRSRNPERPPERVSFPTRDGGVIAGDLYGAGERGVLLAHGGRFTKESWANQAQQLAAAGFQVLAIDFRGFGQSRGPGQEDTFTAPLHLDVLDGVQLLRERGAKSVAAIGGSLGGGAAASAVIADPGRIDRLVLLGATPDGPPEKLALPKLYIMTRDDASGSGPRLPALQAHFERAPDPKELILLEGSAHAQFMFETEHADRIMREILRFLSPPGTQSTRR